MVIVPFEHVSVTSYNKLVIFFLHRKIWKYFFTFLCVVPKYFFLSGFGTPEAPSFLLVHSLTSLFSFLTEHCCAVNVCVQPSRTNFLDRLILKKGTMLFYFII